MERSSVGLARSIWLFDTAELSPNGSSLFAATYKLSQRYRFRTTPKPEDFLSRKDRRFSNGQFEWNDQMLDVALEFWSDGLVADTQHSTDASDAFLKDVVQGFANILAATYPADLIRQKTYRSELVVYAGRGLSGFCAKLDAFSRELTQTTSDTIEPTSLIFGSEATNHFLTFERRVNTPFSQNKFFSAAQTDTESHQTLLNKLQKILSPESGLAPPVRRKKQRKTS